MLLDGQPCATKCEQCEKDVKVSNVLNTVPNLTSMQKIDISEQILS